MFELKIRTGGAAFRSEVYTDNDGNFILDPDAREVRVILSDVRRMLRNGRTSGKVMDMNGNTCGEWRYED